MIIKLNLNYLKFRFIKRANKKERENSNKNDTFNPEFLEKILLDFGVNGNIKKVSQWTCSYFK